MTAVSLPDPRKPLVSVVVACYNAEAFLRETLDSILANHSAAQPIEVIAVNDGSTDGTRAILDSYGDRVRAIHAALNQGTCKSRNAGIVAASGEFVAFCDHDDLWEPDKLAVQVPLFDDPAVGLVCANSDALADGRYRPLYGTDYRLPPDGRAFKALLESNFVICSSAVVRRKALDEVGLFDPDLFPGEDIDLWLRIAKKWKVARAEPILVHYRLMPTQFSRNKIAMRAARVAVIERHGPLLNDQQEFNRILAFYLFYFGEEYCYLGDIVRARAKFRETLRRQPVVPKYLAWFLASQFPAWSWNAARRVRRRLRSVGSKYRSPILRSD